MTFLKLKKEKLFKAFYLFFYIFLNNAQTQHQLWGERKKAQKCVFVVRSFFTILSFFEFSVVPAACSSQGCFMVSQVRHVQVYKYIAQVPVLWPFWWSNILFPSVKERRKKLKVLVKKIR